MRSTRFIARARSSENASVMPELEQHWRAFLDELDQRDGYAAGHHSTVCRLAVQTGRALGLAGRELAAVATGALLHDVGKAFIYGGILAKTTALTESEWETIRLHPVFGETLLRPGLFEAAVLRIVRSHHERWDGAGYPDGIGGRSIPLGARIVSAADALSAMCEARPYCPPLSLDDAVIELERGAWTQFDGHCVRALVESLSTPRISRVQREAYAS